MVKYYEQENLWNKELTSQEMERIYLVNDIIPSDVKRILDVGCGSGTLTNSFDNNKYEITGVDRSKEALKYYKHNKIEGSIDRLPFSDNSFDLVICSDVLEHLPLNILERTIAELKRVSAKYLLIISPHNEELLQNSTQCKKCNSIYHINDHLHSFNTDNIKEMFDDDFDVKLISYFGDRWNFKHENVLKLAHDMNIFIQYENAICPKCAEKCDITDFERIDNSKKLLDTFDKIEYKEYNEKCEVLLLFERKISFIKTIFSKRDKSELKVLKKNISYKGEGLFYKNNPINIQQAVSIEVEKTVILPKYKQYHINYLEQSPLYGKVIINNNSNWFFDKSLDSIYYKNNYSIDNHAIFLYPSIWIKKNNKMNIVYDDTVVEQLIFQVYDGIEYQTIGILNNMGTNQMKTDQFEFPLIKTIKNHLIFRLISSSENNFSINIKSISLNPKDENNLTVIKSQLKNGTKRIAYPKENKMIIATCDYLVYQDSKKELYYLADGVFYEKDAKQ